MIKLEEARLFSLACELLNRPDATEDAKDEAIVALGMLREGANTETMRHRARFALNHYRGTCANETPRTSEAIRQPIHQGSEY